MVSAFCSASFVVQVEVFSWALFCIVEALLSYAASSFTALSLSWVSRSISF